MKNYLSILFITLSLTACTWVKLTPEGEKVRAATMDEVKSCMKLGKTTVSLKADIAGIKRNPGTVQKELESLARNTAVDLKGDTVVPASEIKDGKQVYDVYRCINP